MSVTKNIVNGYNTYILTLKHCAMHPSVMTPSDFIQAEREKQGPQATLRQLSLAACIGVAKAIADLMPLMPQCVTSNESCGLITWENKRLVVAMPFFNRDSEALLLTLVRLGEKGEWLATVQMTVAKDLTADQILSRISLELIPALQQKEAKAAA